MDLVIGGLWRQEERLTTLEGNTIEVPQVRITSWLSTGGGEEHSPVTRIHRCQIHD
nr:hypothetical protein [Mesorhizobium sp.]